MKKFRHFYLLCISLCALMLHASAQNTIDTTGQNSGKTYAVVIGISQYQNKTLPALKYADKDATLFASFLQSKAGGNVPDHQMKLLLNEGATIAAVYDALDWLKEQCRQNDIAYVYFSGHGDVETNNNFSPGYLLAFNTPPNNYPNNAISIADLNRDANILSLTKKAKVILITDACHSGKLAGDFYKGKQLAASQLRLVLNNEVRLTSCAADEEAAEGPGWGGGRGVFSYYLLLGMYGFADLEKKGSIRLNNLNQYLDSSFKADKNLALLKHKQHPVTDGNPNFPLALVDAATVAAMQAAAANKDSAKLNSPGGLSAFKPLGIQPIDYFFSVFEKRDLETALNFKSYSGLAVEALPLKMLDDCIVYQQRLFKERDSLFIPQGTDGNYEYFDIDSLNLLKNQLIKNKSVLRRFNELLVQAVHQKGQEMVNAYLGGDLAELEKRQYYYSGKRQYSDYLSMLHFAMQIAPPDHQLARLLKVHDSYLSGLIERLKMATSAKNESLLKSAFRHQKQALKLEPYAAYIHNELGNLYLNKKRYDSAEYHFGLAAVLAPTWAIPWSNRIRMNLAQNKLAEATKAIQKSDSLQPNLAYAMVNAGLVMEKKKNWLAAETFYLKAIAKNKVHFLPYERLGNIYLMTGDYAKADTFLYEAKTRKDDFAINDQQFKLGVELGGILYQNDPVEKDSCTIIPTADNARLHPFINLANGLEKLEVPATNPEEGIRLIREALRQTPTIPLAHHYLGKQLYLQGKWQLAADALVQAIANHRAGNALKAQLKGMLDDANTATENSCLLNRLMYYQYDLLEDLYLLARVYEKLAMPDKAILQYEAISKTENERQTEQAKYKGFSFDFKYDSDKAHQLSQQLMDTYERPIWMGGAIKAARLYEQQGEFLEAEKTLLRQVALSRTAGDQRQAAITAGIPGTWKLLGGLKINFYWLNINSYLESETNNFYKRMMYLFPREGEWKEKAGLFLHNRLAMAFNQMPIEQYQLVYGSIGNYAYPWVGGEDPPNEFDFDMRIVLPGTTEEIVIKRSVFDPVKESLENLQQSVKLSGDLNAPARVLEAMADLNSWMGNSDEAIKIYNEVTSVQPANALLRNKVLNYLEACNELTAACQQLDTLYRWKQIQANQLRKLANWQILSGRNQEASSLLKNYQSKNAVEKSEVILLFAKMNWLSGQHQKALSWLQNPSSVIQLNEIDGEEMTGHKIKRRSSRLYSIARQYALLKQGEKAFTILQQALADGFNYKYVLDNDTAWTAIRGTNKWKGALQNYTFNLDEGINSYPVQINPIIYRIPGYKNQD